MRKQVSVIPDASTGWTAKIALLAGDCFTLLLATMENDLVRLKLSVQRALLGEVTGNLAALTVGHSGTHIRMVATFFTDPTDEDRESVGSAAGGVIADYPAPYTIATEFRTMADGRPQTLDFWAFIRAGVQVGPNG